MPCPKTPFPRAALPSDFGTTVMMARKAKGWSQRRLATKVGVWRETIARLEAGTTVPSLQLVQALLRDEVLGGNPSLVVAWELDEPDCWKRGQLARAARVASGRTLKEVVAEAGGSIASLSAFERGLLAPVAFAGDHREDSIKRYALALGFANAADMKAYLKEADPRPWLAKIAARCGRALPPAALMPTRCVPVADDTAELPAFLFD